MLRGIGVPPLGQALRERSSMSGKDSGGYRQQRAAWLAEFLGTFAIVFAGTGAIIAHGVSKGVVTHPGIAATFGGVVLVAIYAFGKISGAHFNPAVTVAFAAAGRFRWGQVPAYVASQCAGAVAASGLLTLLFPAVRNLGATVPSDGAIQSLVYETLLTAFLMLVILQVSVGAKEQGITAGMVIGGTVGLEAMFAGPICGASMNPARSLGPALFQGSLDSLWIYCLGPMVGALLAVPLHRILQAASPASPPARS